MIASGPLLSVWYGILSGISLPVGAALGLRLKPAARWTSSLMAFGAGALLSALTLELVAGGLKKAGFGPLAFGCITGALLFMLLNKTLNSSGGFLRKQSTAHRHLSRQKLAAYAEILKKLGTIELLRRLPPEEAHAVLPHVHEARFKAGEVIFSEGDPGDKLYLIESGSVEVHRAGSEGEKIATLAAGDSFGEMALISGEPRNASVKALSDVSALTISKDDFARLLETSPRLKQEVSRLFLQRIEQRYQGSAADEARKWSHIAKAHISLSALLPSEADIESAAKRHGSASFAIWLGNLLDGIPESVVIGASMIHSESVNIALLAGVFLANLPEALSSAVGMSKAGQPKARIMWMWSSLMLLAGIGSLAGNVLFGNLHESLAVGMEGLAAGAMLAMIAETMLPEATEQGGPATGLMTVLGFLAAIFVHTLSSHQ